MTRCMDIAMKEFKLKIITPMGEFFSGNIESIKLKDAAGYFEILANHMEMITTAPPHKASMMFNGEEKKIEMLDSVVEINKEQVTILTNKAQWVGI